MDLRHHPPSTPFQLAKYPHRATILYTQLPSMYADVLRCRWFGATRRKSRDSPTCGWREASGLVYIPAPQFSAEK